MEKILQTKHTIHDPHALDAIRKQGDGSGHKPLGSITSVKVNELRKSSTNVLLFNSAQSSWAFNNFGVDPFGWVYKPKVEQKKFVYTIIHL